MKSQSSQSGIQRSSESGNVLFLILIAVALFAALSYAVTQSTRSGGGDANRETTLVNSSTITQYPASIKTAIVRMIVSSGVSVDQLLFDAPSGFSNLTTPAMIAHNVFHPDGGGASYQLAPSSVMASGTAGTWRFNAANQIYNIGKDTTADNTGNDVIAFLPGVSQSICERIHTQLGLSTTVPTETGILFAAANDMDYDLSPSIPTGAAPIIGVASAGGSILNGQPQGCFQQSGYNYFHVLVER